jgi:hypothetical protein
MSSITVPGFSIHKKYTIFQDGNIQSHNAKILNHKYDLFERCDTLEKRLNSL